MEIKRDPPNLLWPDLFHIRLTVDGVLSSAWPGKLSSFIKRNKSNRIMLNKMGPKMDPCVLSKNLLVSVIILSFLSVEQLNISFRETLLKLYDQSFTIKNSCKTQSKAFGVCEQCLSWQNFNLFNKVLTSNVVYWTIFGICIVKYRFHRK